jgi:hypothetical protein
LRSTYVQPRCSSATVSVPGKEPGRLFSRPPPGIMDKRTPTGLWLPAIGLGREYGFPHGTCPSGWNPTNFPPVSLVLSPFLESLVPLLFVDSYPVPSAFTIFFMCPRLSPCLTVICLLFLGPSRPITVIKGQPAYMMSRLLRVRPWDRGFQ